MNGYFKPLRRKIGLFTLGLACVFAAGWVRSLSMFDAFYQPIGESIVDLAAWSGVSHWTITSKPGNRSDKVLPIPPERHVQQSLEKPIEVIPIIDYPQHGITIETYWHWSSFSFSIANCSDFRQTEVALPYWSIVIPLTLLSALLLLSRPRAPKPVPPVADIAP